MIHSTISRRLFEDNYAIQKPFSSILFDDIAKLNTFYFASFRVLFSTLAFGKTLSTKYRTFSLKLQT